MMVYRCRKCLKPVDLTGHICSYNNKNNSNDNKNDKTKKIKGKIK